MPWYAIRSVYHFGIKSDGTNIFEERVVCFNASSSEEAHKMAEEESKKYERENNFVSHPEQIGYELDPCQLIQGQEVWSELFEGKESLNEFYKNRYESYLYRPE